MPVLRTMCCAAVLVLTAAIPTPANAAIAHGRHRPARPAAARLAAQRQAAAKQCALPTDVNHLPHPVLSARLNKDRTVTFHGRTCPGLLIGVFEVHGKRVKNIAEDLVCDDLADSLGRYSCTSIRRYPINTKFGVVISGQFIVGLQIPAPPPRHPRRPPHPRPHPRPHGAPQTGFGGRAGAVAQHRIHRH